MLTSVTGINWGDEGKGRVIDLLAENADIVVRYQGNWQERLLAWFDGHKRASGIRAAITPVTLL